MVPLLLKAIALTLSGILLFRQSESIILAFSRRCTHAGATLSMPLVDGSSRCSSHGSEILIYQVNQQKGPASSKLDQYIVEIVSNIIKVSKS